MVLIYLGMASRNPTCALAVIGRCFNIRIVLDKVNGYLNCRNRALPIRVWSFGPVLDICGELWIGSRFLAYLR